MHPQEIEFRNNALKEKYEASRRLFAELQAQNSEAFKQFKRFESEVERLESEIRAIGARSDHLRQDYFNSTGVWL